MPAMSLRTVLVLVMTVCASTLVLGMPQEGRASAYKRATAGLAQREIPTPILPATVVQPIVTKRQSDEHSEPPHPKPSGQFRQHDKRQESHSDHPTPSHRPSQKRQHDNGDDEKPHPPQPSHGFLNGDKRRGLNEQESLVVATEMYAKLCPVELLPCPIGQLGSLATLPSSLAEWNAKGFECVDMMADLHSCGGCASLDAR